MEPKVICVLVMALALALGSLAQSEGGKTAGPAPGWVRPRRASLCRTQGVIIRISELSAVCPRCCSRSWKDFGGQNRRTVAAG